MNDLTEQLIDDTQDPSSKVCLICSTFRPNFSKIKPCNHDFCQDCMRMYLEYKIINGEVLKMQCPFNDCQTQLEDSYIKSLVTSSSYMKYKTFRRLRLLEKNINLRWCSKIGCEGYSIGSVKNKKLTCNKCDSNFCYFCGNDWHEGKKCSNKLDKEFEKWASSNSIKFCPNCKHRVLRDGGCTEMKCPLCSYSWCWNCGNNMKDHNDYHCMMGKNMFELYWTTIFTMIFSPILLPFAIFLFIILKNEYFHIHQKHLKTWIKILTYFGLFLISPALLVVGMVGYCIMFSTQFALEFTGRTLYIVALLIGVVFGTLIACFGFLLLALVAILLPPIGVFFLLIKTAFVLKRRCKYEKKWEYYPRTVV